MIAWFQAHSVEVFAALFAVSEALALIPYLKSNSVFQFIYNALKKAAGK